MVFDEVLAPVVSKAREAIQLLSASEARERVANQSIADLQKKLASVEAVPVETVKTLLARAERLGLIPAQVKTATTHLMTSSPAECMRQLADLAFGHLESISLKTATDTGKLVDISGVQRNPDTDDNWFRRR